MDTTAQNQTTTSGTPQQGQPVAPPQNVQPTQSVSTDQSQGQPTLPVTPGGKEIPPMPSAQNKEWVQESTPEIVVPKEAQEIGAEVAPSEVLQVPQDVASQGVKAVGTAVPLPTEPTLKFPMTEEKAEGILKMHKKVKDSIYWLAMLVVRQFKMLKQKGSGQKSEELKEAA